MYLLLVFQDLTVNIGVDFFCANDKILQNKVAN